LKPQIVRVRRYETEDAHQVVRLVVEFRLTLSGLKPQGGPPDYGSARQELDEYLAKGFPVFIAEDEERKIVGYMVCRVDEDVVWVESLYVSECARRQGIGSALYSEAEHLADSLGGDTVYNWVHPNNHVVISFLKKRGYNVLNLVEIRRPRKGERLGSRIQVGAHKFDY
jgi:ribosomal protein S18 acetylase RimI-like enzyme